MRKQIKEIKEINVKGMLKVVKRNQVELKKNSFFICIKGLMGCSMSGPLITQQMVLNTHRK